MSPDGPGKTPVRSSRSQRVASAATSSSSRRSGEALTEVAVEVRAHPLHAGDLGGVQRLAPPAPQDRAQLVLDVEADAVVDAVAVAVRHRQHVAALAVGVVDDDVEDGHPAQRRGVLVDQGQRPVVVVDARRTPRASPRRDVAAGTTSTGVLRGVGLLPELHHARARAVRRAGSCGGTTSQPNASETR